MHPCCAICGFCNHTNVVSRRPHFPALFRNTSEHRRGHFVAILDRVSHIPSRAFSALERFPIKIVATLEYLILRVWSSQSLKRTRSATTRALAARDVPRPRLTGQRRGSEVSTLWLKIVLVMAPSRPVSKKQSQSSGSRHLQQQRRPSGAPRSSAIVGTASGSSTPGRNQLAAKMPRHANRGRTTGNATNVAAAAAPGGMDPGGAVRLGFR